MLGYALLGLFDKLGDHVCKVTKLSDEMFFFGSFVRPTVAINFGVGGGRTRFASHRAFLMRDRQFFLESPQFLGQHGIDAHIILPSNG
jgi:hypothetical protein